MRFVQKKNRHYFICLIKRTIRRWFWSNCSVLFEASVYLFRRCFWRWDWIGGRALYRFGMFSEGRVESMITAFSSGILWLYAVGSDCVNGGRSCWVYGIGAATRFSISSNAIGGECNERAAEGFRIPMSKGQIRHVSSRFHIIQTILFQFEQLLSSIDQCFF